MTRIIQVLGFLAALFGGLVARAFAVERPNILLCVADDWGWPHARAYGDPVVKTPAFDRLGREGLVFERAFACSPSCTPSRNGILTGQQFYRLGEGANLRSTLDVSYPNFMYLMERNGYTIGHWRKVWGPGDYKAGGYTRHPAGEDMTFERFMAQRDKGKPFCFWFGAADPHRPYEKGSGAAGGIDLSAIPVPPFLPAVDVTRSDLADYYYEVERWDRDVGKAIEVLEKSGELDNTIIVMTGDNGAPFPRGKGNLYDFGVRVPLVIRWGKGIAAPGHRVKDFVSLIDLGPTFLAAAGVEAPAVMTGKSMLPILQSDNFDAVHPGREWIVVGRERHAAAQKMPSLDGYPSRALRTDQYLYIVNLKPDRWPVGVPRDATHPIGQFADCDDGPTKQYLIDHGDEPAMKPLYTLCFAKRPAEELYDVQADPYEVHNLAQDPAYREALATLREQLAAYLKKTGDPRFTDQAVKFDEYPYRDKRIEERIRKYEEEQAGK